MRDDLLHLGRDDPSHRGLADPDQPERFFPSDYPSHRGLAAAIDAAEADLEDLGRRAGRDDPSHRGLSGPHHYVQTELELFGRPVRVQEQDKWQTPHVPSLSHATGTEMSRDIEALWPSVPCTSKSRLEGVPFAWARGGGPSGKQTAITGVGLTRMRPWKQSHS